MRKSDYEVLPPLFGHPLDVYSIGGDRCCIETEGFPDCTIVASQIASTFEQNKSSFVAIPFLDTSK